MQPNAAASLNTTAQDFGRFVSAILKGTGLKKETLKMMLTPQVKVSESGTNNTARSPERLSPTISWDDFRQSATPWMFAASISTRPPRSAPPNRSTLRLARGRALLQKALWEHACDAGLRSGAPGERPGHS